MSKLRIPVSERDHTLGPSRARITLVEYGDYQCPFCAQAHVELKRLTESMRDDLRFVFRNFPLSQAHEYAMLGAMSAEAAGLQDKFWPMHDIIYENQPLLGPEGVFGFARALDLDLAQFQDDLNNQQLMDRIQEDFMGGVRSGVNGTPSFFLNGYKYEGPLDARVFRRLLSDEGAARPSYL